jgi:hypothetical protein
LRRLCRQFWRVSNASTASSSPSTTSDSHRKLSRPSITRWGYVLQRPVHSQNRSLHSPSPHALTFAILSTFEGTIVVLAATVVRFLLLVVHLVLADTISSRSQLLILVSVSTPLLKSIYFLEANLSSGNYSGTVRLGAWGYCVGGTCTSPKLGYSLSQSSRLSSWLTHSLANRMLPFRRRR